MHIYILQDFAISSRSLFFRNIYQHSCHKKVKLDSQKALRPQLCRIKVTLKYIVMKLDRKSNKTSMGCVCSALNDSNQYQISFQRRYQSHLPWFYSSFAMAGSSASYSPYFIQCATHSPWQLHKTNGITIAQLFLPTPEQWSLCITQNLAVFAESTEKESS